ncbi:MAG TPA: POTRA domain-containing protein, partial [Verrucomicrobiae bacterium]
MIRFPLRHVCLLGFILLAATLRLEAQLRDLPREIVREIIITNVGPQTVSDFLVRANIRVRVGEPYNRPSVDDDVRNLNATGFFANL